MTAAPQYTEEQIAFFASYTDRRAPFAAAECNHDDRCWVENGPPCMDRQTIKSICAGCHGIIGRLRPAHNLNGLGRHVR